MQNLDIDDLAASAMTLVRVLCNDAPVHASRIKQGVMTFKFMVEGSSGRYFVVRFYPESRANVASLESDLLRRLHDAGLPVPLVLADWRTGPQLLRPYLIYEAVKGTSLSARFDSMLPESKVRLGKKVLECLRLMAELKVNGYGNFISAKDAQFDSFSEFMKTSFQEGISAARLHNTLPLDCIHTVERIASTFTEIPIGGKASVCWGDVSLGNILVNRDNQLAALLDFEGAIAADPLLNLGYCYAAYGDSSFFALLKDLWPESFGPISWVRLELYAVLRAIRIVPFMHQPLPNGEPRKSVINLLPGFPIACASLKERIPHR